VDVVIGYRGVLVCNQGEVLCMRDYDIITTK
jgi:hypothetical protein